MDRRTVITLGLIILVIGGAFAFLLLNGDAKQAMQKTLDTSVSDAQKESGAEESANESVSSSAPGQYVNYSESALANADGTKLIFFHASWCPQCRELETSIKAKGVPSGVSIFKVDYDTSQALRQKYGVTIQTTVVRVDDQGNLVKKFVAYDEPSLDAVIKNLL